MREAAREGGSALRQGLTRMPEASTISTIASFRSTLELFENHADPVKLDGGEEESVDL